MSSSKLIVILGATGLQGGSVLDTFLTDPSWKIRALTRNASSAKAQSLASRSPNIEVVSAEANDVKSLLAAFKGATAIFAVTDFWTTYSDPSSKERLKPGQALNEFCFEIELQQGRNIFDAASQISTLERLVYSSLANVSKWSGGKYKNVLHFDAKAFAVEYGRATYPDLWSKTSIIQVGMYLRNYLDDPWMKPYKSENGTYLFRLPEPLEAPIPFVVAEHDTGPVVKTLVELPASKNVVAYRELMTVSDFIQLWSKILDVPVDFRYGPLPLPEDLQEEIDENWKFGGEFGYWANDDKTVIHPKDLGVNFEFGTVGEWIKAQDWSFVVEN